VITSVRATQSITPSQSHSHRIPATIRSTNYLPDRWGLLRLLESDLPRPGPSICPVTERPWFRLLTKKSRAGPCLGTSSIPCFPFHVWTTLVDVKLVGSTGPHHYHHVFSSIVQSIVRPKAERTPPILHGLCQQLLPFFVGRRRLTERSIGSNCLSH
jgi:hypothetical protein